MSIIPGIPDIETPGAVAFSGNAVPGGAAVAVTPGQSYRIKNNGGDNVSVFLSLPTARGGQAMRLGGYDSKPFQVPDGVTAIYLASSVPTPCTVTAVTLTAGGGAGEAALAGKQSTTAAALARLLAVPLLPVTSASPAITTATGAATLTAVPFSTSQVRTPPVGYVNTGAIQPLPVSPSGYVRSTSLEFGYYGQAFEVVEHGGGGAWRMFVDGRLAVPQTAGAANTARKFDFGSVAVRRVRYESIGVRINGFGAEAGGSLFALDLPARPLVGLVGDSYFYGSSELNPTVGAFAADLERMCGVDAVRLGIPGTGYLNNAGTAGQDFLSRAVANLQGAGTVAQGAPPAYSLIAIGSTYNDRAQSQAAIEAAVASTVAAVRAAYPGVPILLLGCWTPQGGTNAAAAAFVATDNAARSQAIALGCMFLSPRTGEGLGAAGQTLIAPGAPWFGGTGKAGSPARDGSSDAGVIADGVHPTSYFGHPTLAWRISQYLCYAMPALVNPLSYA